MYLHIGQNVMVQESRIIGIFDLDIVSQSKRTQAYLRQAEQDGVILPCGEELPKSFLVCDHPYHPQIIYMSQLGVQTLQKRAEADRPFSPEG